MENLLDRVTFQAAGLGTIAGMRTMLAPAVVSHFLSKNPSVSLNDSKLAFIQSPAIAGVTKVLSVAELGGDKLPQIGNRTSLPQTLARVASGSLVGR